MIARARSVASLATVMVLACRAPAQEPAPPAAELTVQNLAPHPRTDWATATVPFAPGQVPAGSTPELTAEGGLPTAWQPLGARWADGSLRHALCFVRAPIDALAERRVRLVTGAPDAGGGGAPAIPTLRVTFHLRQGDRTTTAEAAPAEVLESNAARRVELWRCRVGDPSLVCELIVTAWRGQGHLDAGVGAFFSDPDSEHMQCRIDELAVTSDSLALTLRHARLLAVEQAATASGSRCRLLAGVTLGDGQGIRRVGVLVPRLGGDDAANRTLLAAVTCPLLAAADPAVWRAAGAWGPFGVVPELPPAMAAPQLQRAALARHHRAFVAQEARARGGDPLWNGPFGLARRAGQTGDQNDFGLHKLAVVPATGLPSPLLEVEPSVLQEACRPVHFFERDGSPVQPARHPHWVVWSGRTHWHCEVSKDRLGKPCPEPRFQTHGWSGKDRQHWSSNYLTAQYLLTGSPSLRREVDNEVRLFLAAQTVDPQLSTSGAGAPRGAGRTLLAGCWLWLCTGDDALRARILERVQRVHWPAWQHSAHPAERVRPLMVCAPDARMLDGRTRFWNPWQEAIAAAGYGAVHRLFGDERAGRLAAGLAINVVRHGFKLDQREAVIATAMRWSDGGAPLDAATLAAARPGDVVWSYGTAFSLWALPCVELAARYAREAGDEPTAQRAQEIARIVRSRRGPDPVGFIDGVYDWEGAR